MVSTAECVHTEVHYEEAPYALVEGDRYPS